jgi:hypothetical protein
MVALRFETLSSGALIRYAGQLSPGEPHAGQCPRVLFAGKHLGQTRTPGWYSIGMCIAAAQLLEVYITFKLTV